VSGVNTQDPAYQKEAAERIHLPFDLLSDILQKLVTELSVPTFEVESRRLMTCWLERSKRQTGVCTCTHRL
jgi:peroxiredoxin